MHGGDIFATNHAVAYNNFPEDTKFDWSNSKLKSSLYSE